MAKDGDARAKPAGVQDSRFARLHTDPRFQRFPSAKNKVKVDERFRGMFSDKEFRVAPRVDKYGRKASGGNEDGLMHKFYELEDEDAAEPGSGEEDVDDAALLALHGDEEDDAAAASADKSKQPRRKIVDRARGIGVSDESSSESSSDEEERDERDEAAGEEEGVLAQWLDGAAAGGARAGAESDEEGGEQLDAPTHRLAVLNCDWDHVSAADLYVLLSSFLPAGGQVVSVSVYPSQFGRERMAKEAVAGPQLGYAQPLAEAAQPEQPATRPHDPRGKASRRRAREREIPEYDEQKLREYELGKLRYYYAVADFDCARSAAAVHDECGGLEVEASSMVLECRYVPDGMGFDEEEAVLRDRATEAPPGYACPAFATKALQQSRVQLSWDADDSARAKVLRRDFAQLKKAGELREDDFKAYLASSSEEEEGTDEGQLQRQREAYAAQLLGGDTSDRPADGAVGGARRGAGKAGGKERRGGAEGDVEITFVPQLEQQAAAAREDETVWEARQRKRRERRGQAKRGGAQAAADGAEEGADGDEFGHYAQEGEGEGAGGDDFFMAMNGDEGEGGGAGKRTARVGAAAEHGARGGGRGGKRGRRAEAEIPPAEQVAAAKRKAELELLMLGDAGGGGGGGLGGGGFFSSDGFGAGGAGGGDDRHYDLKALLRQAKGPKKRHAKGKHAGRADDDAAEGMGGDFRLDASDPRFAAVGESAEFAIDPTDAKYRKTLGEKRARAHARAGASGTSARRAPAHAHCPAPRLACRVQGWRRCARASRAPAPSQPSASAVPAGPSLRRSPARLRRLPTMCTRAMARSPPSPARLPRSTRGSLRGWICTSPLRIHSACSRRTISRYDDTSSLKGARLNYRG